MHFSRTTKLNLIAKRFCRNHAERLNSIFDTKLDTRLKQIYLNGFESFVMDLVMFIRMLISLIIFAERESIPIRNNRCLNVQK